MIKGTTTSAARPLAPCWYQPARVPARAGCSLIHCGKRENFIRSRLSPSPLDPDRPMNLLEYSWDMIAIFPRRVMRLKFSHVANPPDVIASAVVLDVGPVELF